MHLTNIFIIVYLQDEKGRTPLHVASEIGRTEMVQLLLERSTQTNLVDTDQNTPLHFAVLFCNEYILENKTLIVSMLLDARATCNVQNRVGRTALHYASARGYDTIVSQLISAGAQLNVPDTDGKTALYWSIEKSQGDVYQLLFRAGAWLYECSYETNTMTVYLLTSSVDQPHYVDFLIAADRQHYILNRYGEQRRVSGDDTTKWYLNNMRILLMEGARPKTDSDIAIVTELVVRSRSVDLFTSLLNAGTLPRFVASDLGVNLCTMIRSIASDPMNTTFIDSMVDMLYNAGIIDQTQAMAITPYLYTPLSLQLLCRKTILKNMRAHSKEDFDQLLVLPPYLRMFTWGCNL